MTKIKLGIFPSDGAGIGHFRSIWPAQQIQKDYGNDFEVHLNPSPDFSDIEYFKSFDIIHFHRQLGAHENMPKFFEELRANNVIMIMDIDDYWEPPITHPMYQAAKNENIAGKTLETFKHVDYVTTTTDIFAEYISKHNKNVQVIPNAIDVNHKMWAQSEVEHDERVRFSYIAGSSHLADLELMNPSMNRLHNDESMKGKYQIVMCGYDIRGTITEINEHGKEVRTRKIEPHETVWNKFEEILTNNYNPNIISPEYKKYLKKCSIQPYSSNVLDETYVRRWTLPLTQYGKHYNYCDVCLAPLVENTFNRAKSELKIIEAGMMKKALIAQDFSIYNEFIINNENGILVSKINNSKGWYEAIKKVATDREFREKIANNLHEFVKAKYNLKTVTDGRVLFYKKIYENKENSVLHLTA